jgi:hypothetical protein
VGDILARNWPFGTASPFVFASACDTGKYIGVTSFAESILQKGAINYLGSTFHAGWTAQATKFFEMWDANEPVSLALKQTKINIGDDWTDDVWRAAYHLYGDAKFGATTTVSSKNAIVQPVPSIDVVVPDYIVTRSGGIDHVEIPHGLLRTATGEPEIPYYRVLYEYPKGYRIQDVSLSYRSDPLKIKGLNIPNAVVTLPINGMTGLLQSQTTEWPLEKKFDWYVYENPNGITLVLTVYAFEYNPLTLDASFYGEYRFDVKSTFSDVSTSNLDNDKEVYDVGDKIRFDLGLENSALTPQSVVVSAFIEDETSGQVVSGLDLSTLTSLRNKAAYSSEWDSAGMKPGDYNLVLEVRDTQGVMLDKIEKSVRLGRSEVEITALTVNPQNFTSGQEVRAQIGFKNTGFTNVSGQAIIRVINSAGDTIKEFSHEIGDLSPSQSADFSVGWGTNGAAPGVYTFVGFVLYDGNAADPKTVQVETASAPVSIFELIVGFARQYALPIMLLIFGAILIVIIARRKKKSGPLSGSQGKLSKSIAYMKSRGSEMAPEEHRHQVYLNRLSRALADLNGTRVGPIPSHPFLLNSSIDQNN